MHSNPGLRPRRGIFTPLRFLLAVALIAAGCRTVSLPPNPPTSSEAAQHIIRVDERGVLLQLDGKPAPADYAETNLIGPLRRVLETERHRYPKGALLFVHGGLNDYDDAMHHFRLQFRDLQTAGYYPLFLMWPSGLIGTYRDHLLKIRQGRREDSRIGRIFAAATVPLVLVQDIATGLVRTPMTTLQSLRSDLQTAIPPNTRLGERDAVDIYRRLAAAEERVIIGHDFKSTRETTVRAVAYATTLPTKVATAGPIIDAFGRPAWDDMLRRTYMVYPGSLAKNEFISNATVQGTTRINLRLDARRGFAIIVRELETLQAQHRFPLTLVGHSMGTIVLNHVLQGTTLDADRIVYLAAACSIRDYAEAVLPYLSSRPNAQSYNLTLHPMAEDGEWQKKLWDAPPRGSLLVWIDNFLSNPAHEHDRTFGRWTNLFTASATGNSAIEDILWHRGTAGRTSFRAFGVGGGSTPRPPRFQWSILANPNQPPPAQRPPDTHAKLAGIPYWDDDVLNGPP